MPDQDLPALFCKPKNDGSTYETLFQRDLHDIGKISFRSLKLDSDLSMIHDWVNREYSRAFWQMNGSRDLLESTYKNILCDPHSHSFIGSLNGQPTCQIDLYQVLVDELRSHVNAEDNDCGLHLLMSPPNQRKKDTTPLFFKTFLAFYFSFPEAERMFGEPDRENIKSNNLVTDTGFKFIKQIELSYKTANLYCLTKTQFYAAHQTS